MPTNWLIQVRKQSACFFTGEAADHVRISFTSWKTKRAATVFSRRTERTDLHWLWEEGTEDRKQTETGTSV